jgi:hypothetical protein
MPVEVSTVWSQRQHWTQPNASLQSSYLLLTLILQINRGWSSTGKWHLNSQLQDPVGARAWMDSQRARVPQSSCMRGVAMCRACCPTWHAAWLLVCQHMHGAPSRPCGHAMLHALRCRGAKESMGPLKQRWDKGQGVSAPATGVGQVSSIHQHVPCLVVVCMAPVASPCAHACQH